MLGVFASPPSPPRVSTQPPPLLSAPSHPHLGGLLQLPGWPGDWTVPDVTEGPGCPVLWCFEIFICPTSFGFRASGGWGTGWFVCGKWGWGPPTPGPHSSLPRSPCGLCPGSRGLSVWEPRCERGASLVKDGVRGVMMGPSRCGIIATSAQSDHLGTRLHLETAHLATSHSQPRLTSPTPQTGARGSHVQQSGRMASTASTAN